MNTNADVMLNLSILLLPGRQFELHNLRVPSRAVSYIFGFLTNPRVAMETAAQAALDPRVFWISRLQS